MLKFYMRFFIVIIVIFSVLHAKEPNLMILDAIYANNTLVFRQNRDRFVCKSYGIVALDKIFENKKITNLCKKALKDFIISNPKLINYAKYHLKTEQTYRIEFKNNKCIIYSNSKTTYSEMLLLNGLAVLKNGFKDEEFDYRYKKALMSAKVLKKGFWKNFRLKSCIKQLYKE